MADEAPGRVPHAAGLVHAVRAGALDPLHHPQRAGHGRRRPRAPRATSSATSPRAPCRTWPAAGCPAPPAGPPGSTARRSRATTQPAMRPSPDGRPRRNPVVRGSSRVSTTPMIGSEPRPSSVAVGLRGQSSRGVSSGGPGSWSSGDSAAGGPSTQAASTAGPSWSRRTRSCDAPRPSRRTVTSMVAGPGSGACRNVPVTACGQVWSGRSSAIAARAARASTASR